MDLRGKTVFITGAARGIGAESARRLAARGANVALAGLEPEELERVARQCGTNAEWFECDVTDWDALERAVEGTVERFGGLDVVMANAGIATGGMARS
ncbi:MAG TPA: SDR family NAD(P)-dependent oxidoreductase, partial [Thermoleophilaceae bacterium]|nr:SDR family NAD(P)-dependent oxidoreductase [Thermoleophilaceae bacterium]